ncbi:MAG: R3H domain-containing nucleic acid-binding protein [Candidatus Parcubacteria bacterium]|nr:R3H domain-containing nucleic acid-binding protein [Candidatus Parcubacteria bacterium]
MMSHEDVKKIRETVQEFFSKMSFDVTVKVEKPEDLTVPVSLETEDPQILIGENGQTLLEIQRLLKGILRKRITDPFFLNIDINDYKKKKTEYLKEMANTIADEVSLLKQDKELPPMPAHERRVVHMALAERPDIISESFGTDPDRKIIVKPKTA